MGVLRPVVIRLAADPVPGVCEGLKQGLQGMRVGGKRTVRVPAALGFGAAPAVAPYGEPQVVPPVPACVPASTPCLAEHPNCLGARADVLPGGSTVQYEIELLRLSRTGPDALVSGISQASSTPAGTVSAAEVLRACVAELAHCPPAPPAPQCGSGFVNERVSGCADIAVAEFL